MGMIRALLLLAFATPAAAQQSADYAGTWVMKSNGQPVMKLTLAGTSDRITGSLTQPANLSIDSQGQVTKLDGEQSTMTIGKIRLKPDCLEFSIDSMDFVMTLQSHDRALLAPPMGMAPWRIERVPDGTPVDLATKLVQPEYPADIRQLRGQLAAMIKEDQDARMAFDFARMEAADAKNRPEVLRIFDRYGWVTNSLAGVDAAGNFFLLVQHQITEIQQRLLPALEKAAKAGDASMTDYAYLYDRVQKGLGKPQHWGSQTNCENGKPVLWPVDDPAGLDARRKELFMPPIGDYLKVDYLVQACAKMK